MGRDWGRTGQKRGEQRGDGLADRVDGSWARTSLYVSAGETGRGPKQEQEETWADSEGKKEKTGWSGGKREELC